MAGGQATNSGIDYQQRIAAWCLINQFSEFDISAFFDQLDEKLLIEIIQFESSETIDDLNLICRNQKIIFMQIKRSISLSIRESSDFYKTVKQFVEEFIKNEYTENYFGLITTNDASSKITNDLKKIAVSIKINENSFEQNPLNDSEKDTLNKFELLFKHIYKKIKRIEPDKYKFIAFVKRIFIAVVNVESGSSVEIASQMLLKSLGFSKPELIWAILIKNSLFYATERLSIDADRLKGIFNKYLKDEKDGFLKVDENEIIKTNMIAQGVYSAGKEVLLINSFIEGMDYMIVELYRFTDDCQIKNIFYKNNKMIVGEDDWTVIQRFATMVGLDRFLEENQNFYREKKVALVPAVDIDNVEDTECAKLHKAYLDDLIKLNENILLCLHCGKQVSDDNALLVEIEDKETTPAVGNVHKQCLRPLDRILGVTKIPGKKESKNIEGFDFKLWVSLLLKGQGMLNSLKSSPQLINGRQPLIAWNSNEEYDPEYSYCVKFVLEDGSASYSYLRSRIERLNKFQAQAQVKIFEDMQQEEAYENDPWCVLSVSKQAGPYSTLLRIRKSGETILEIKSAEIAKYSKLIAKAFDKNISHYAPLCIIRDRDDERTVGLSNVIPLISDPLQFDDFLDNWKKVGFELDNVELKIIKSDKDFDNQMRLIFNNRMVPIIDPLFDKNYQLVSGYPIDEFNRMTDRMKKKQNDGTQE